jgi:hypothetical protein
VVKLDNLDLKVLRGKQGCAGLLDVKENKDQQESKELEEKRGQLQLQVATAKLENVVLLEPQGLRDHTDNLD